MVRISILLSYLDPGTACVNANKTRCMYDVGLESMVVSGELQCCEVMDLWCWGHWRNPKRKSSPSLIRRREGSVREVDYSVVHPDARWPAKLFDPPSLFPDLTGLFLSFRRTFMQAVIQGYLTVAQELHGHPPSIALVVPPPAPAVNMLVCPGQES